MGHGAVYRDLPPCEVARDVSNQGLSFRNVKVFPKSSSNQNKLYFLSTQCCNIISFILYKKFQPADYDIPDKRGMSVSWTAQVRKSKPFIGTTTHEATYVKPEVRVIKLFIM